MTPSGLSGKIGGMELNPFKRGLAHGAVHGGAAELQGGEFRHGFYSGFLNGSLDGSIETTFESSETLQYAVAAVVGGTGSVIGGGKFENGAVSGAFSYMFNQMSRPRRGGSILVPEPIARAQAEAWNAGRLRMEARYGIMPTDAVFQAPVGSLLMGRLRLWARQAAEHFGWRALSSGGPETLPSTLSPAQRLHINPTDGRSPLTVNPNELLAGVRDGTYPVVRVGRGNKLLINFGKPIGTYNLDGVAIGPTQYGWVHYGQKGSHIVPASPTQW